MTRVELGSADVAEGSGDLGGGLYRTETKSKGGASSWPHGSKQLASQVAKRGESAASWYCFWDEPDGTRRKKSCGPGRRGKTLASEKADKINAQITLGEYESDRHVHANVARFLRQV